MIVGKQKDAPCERLFCVTEGQLAEDCLWRSWNEVGPNRVGCGLVFLRCFVIFQPIAKCTGFGSVDLSLGKFSIFTRPYLNYMVAELALDWPYNITNLRGLDCVLEFFDVGRNRLPAKFTTIGTRTGVRRNRLREICE